MESPPHRIRQAGFNGKKLEGSIAVMRVILIGLVILAVTSASGFAGTAASEDTSEKKLWKKPRTSEWEKERHDMVTNLIIEPAERGFDDARTCEAMRNVPRHWFVPEKWQKEAYTMPYIPTGWGLTLPHPAVVALMTALLELDEESKVLEVGTGTGYHAAVLNEFTPHVYTIEILEEASETARETLKKHGYETIAVRTADGYDGWEEKAPFDAIVVTCASTHVPPSLLKQLKKRGRMVIPIGHPFAIQTVYFVEKDEQGRAIQKSLFPSAFSPIVRAKKTREGTVEFVPYGVDKP